ncbi:sulfurtransferase complex subunit TusB [Methylohalobius crimeensis]|uniref:sulfurtransferase complex subunit TusB n=1 Tax=Methylohalobius crimeensis TaxID=244365 RepID=UPI0003B5CEF6|nr:sulfurtransferase complex subunit TusB [Methylohalobius crimeensis]
MGVLYLVSRSPYTSLDLAQCLARVGDGDALLLLADAVYAAVPGNPVAEALEACSAACHVLIPDLEARGIARENRLPSLVPVDFEGFVDLTVDYERIVSW